MQKKTRIGIDARVLEWQRGALANFLINLKGVWISSNTKYEFYYFFQNNIPNDLIFSEHETPIIIKGPKILKRKILTDIFLFGRALKKNKIDILFATIYSYPFHSFRKKTFLFLWDITFSTHKSHYGIIKGYVYHFMSKYSAKFAHKIITCSKYDLDIINKNYKVHNKSLYIELPPGSKFKNLSNQKEKLIFLNKYNLPSNYILALGVIYDRRSIDKLLQAYCELVSEKKIKNKLVLVGRNATSKKQNLDEMINKMVSDKLISYFEFFPQKDLNRLYSNSNLYICTSTNDGESIMIKEAAMSGTPVLTNKLLSGSINNFCYLVEEPTSVNSWKNAIIHSLNSNCSEITLKSMNYVKNISWDKVSKTIERLL